MRWVFRLIGLVIVMLAIVLGALFFLPGERIAKLAAEQISKATGRQVTMSGDTKISFYPILGVATGAVEIANAGWSDAGPIFTAESLKIGVEPTALFGGDIRITGLEAVGPQIRLERAADGRVNWELGVEGVAPSGQSEGGAPATANRLSLTLDRALIKGAYLTYTDHGSGEVQAIRDMDFDLRWPDYDGRATFDVVLRQAGDPVTVSGHLEKVGAFIDGAVTDVVADIEGPGGRLGFDGRAGLQPQAQGRFDIDMSDTGAFVAALDLGAVELPQGFGARISGGADVTLTQEMRLSLRNMTLDLGGNALSGAADIDLAGDVPRVNAQLNAGALDLSKLAGADSNESDAASADTGWSRAPIDASGLALANGEVALVADSIDLGDLELGKTRTLMALDRSRAVFSLRELRAYDGLITGEFVANNRSGLSVGGNMKAEGVNLERFLADAMDITRFAASASGEVEFLGVGQSVHAIMNSLSGKGSLRTGRGVISGIDLDRLMRSGDVTGGTTIFDAMSASFTMDEGNLYNRDLAMSLPLARAEGTGRVGLGARDIDYLFTPVLLEGENSRGLAIPVRIEGPWASPRIKPDLEKALDLNLEAEREALEKEAEERLEREVQDRLDVTPQEGQSVEDAVKDKIEDEVGRELRKLFD